MPGQKLNIKDKFEDGRIDLSVCDLQTVPVREIAMLKKAYFLDLSNNNLTSLPGNFSSLIHITELNLNKNQLSELPGDFGNLLKLKHLDLYDNQIKHLPLSFSKLTSLNWLDLSNNPLVPALAKVAGPCTNATECRQCAKNVVTFFIKLQSQIAGEKEVREKQRQRQLIVNQKKEKDDKNKMNNLKTQKKSNKKTNSNKEKTNNNMIRKNENKIQLNRNVNGKRNNLFSKFFSLFFIIFILTSLKFKYTICIENFINKFYHYIIDILPDVCKIYITYFGNCFQIIHEFTGDILTKIFNIEIAKWIYNETLNYCYYPFNYVSSNL